MLAGIPEGQLTKKVYECIRDELFEEAKGVLQMALEVVLTESWDH